MKVICIAGPRPDKLGGYNDNNPLTTKIKNRLYKAIEQAILEGATTFITGGALGVDQWGAEIVLLFKRFYPYLKLIIARPFPGQDELWNPGQIEDYQKLLSQADQVVDVNPDPAKKWKYFARNKWMINESDKLITVWDGDQSGTKDTINHAKRKGIEIQIIRILKHGFILNQNFEKKED
ncbi:MAG TPA: hypothetical protein DDW65_21555 [Firmicutes bacterium]|jgi:uncharacterized phage-like protein YoqJ|nr:hypothetical protein [Bacillota bacterium]